MPQVAAAVAMLEFAAHMGVQPTFVQESATAVVAEHLVRQATGWAVGMVGAVAEFLRAPADRPECDGATRVVTTRGALHIEATPTTRVVRFTTASGLDCIALCLPEAEARLEGRTVLTEVGRDGSALRAADREACLFDLGVPSPYVEFCVRTADCAAIERLRRWAGTPLFGPDSGALHTIAALQPQRVVRSRLARIEVYQPIAAAGGTTPDGPHTHLLPDLLGARQPFDADQPIPAGWIPCVHLYLGSLPAHETGEATYATH